MSTGNKDWDIYIGNIPRHLTKEHIIGLFKKYDIVDADEIHYSGTKTFCFMKLQGEDNITNALTEMNTHNVNGRKLIVRRFEDKRRNKQENNSDTKSNSSSSTFEDVPPPLLETQFGSENNSDSGSFKKSRAYCSSDKFQASGYRLSRQNSSSSQSALSASPHPSGYNHHNATCNKYDTSPQARNSDCSNYHNQMDKTSDFSSVKINTLQSLSPRHSQLSPQGKNTQLRSTDQKKLPLSPNESISQQSDTASQCSADHDQSLEESPEKYRYVHCTRNVISYNPRDLKNNTIRFNSVVHSPSEAVKVWAANFPFGTSKAQMLKLFEDFTPLKVCINNNAPGGDFTRATITLPSLDVAEAAIMELDNTIYKRRTLLVGMVEEGDEYSDDYYEADYDDEEEECSEDGADYYYYEPYDDHREQGYYYRSQNDEQLCYEEPVSRRLHNIHLS